MVARELAVAHTAMYDAWAAYDAIAVGTRLGGSLRRPANERTNENKKRAVSFAAYRALNDLFPSVPEVFDGVMQQLGFDGADASVDITTPTGIGNVAAAAVIAFRHHDRSNQLGDLAPGSYSDYTGYQPVNTPDQVNDPNRWQPLLVQDAQGATTAQKYIAPHWGLVTPFALTSGAQFRPAAVPNLYPSQGYTDQALEIIAFSANLTDEQKTIVEYWADGPGTGITGTAASTASRSGSLCRAISCPVRNSTRSGRVKVAPGRRITQAHMRSPSTGSGRSSADGCHCK